MEKHKSRKKNLIPIIIFIFLIVIMLSIFLIKSNTGNAIKGIDSKQSFKTTTNNNFSSQELTEFNIPTKELLDNNPISQSFKENTKFDLKLDKPITALSVTGSATLLSEAGLVRIILVDSEKHEYLIYEIDSLLANNSKNIDFENVCEETCVLDKPITPVAIKIQVEDAILYLSSTNTLSEDKPFTEVKTDLKNHKQQILRAQNQAKIEKYNSAQKSWTAGETSVSNLSYEEQKRLFTREDGTIPEYLPNLQGFLNYKGGIFTLAETKEQQTKSQDNTTPNNSQENIILPDSWDWRNVHGENWMTSVKDQGSVGTCWAHAMMGALESQINLYYNRQFNMDLSEQMAVDCSSVDSTYPNDNVTYDCATWGCKLMNAGIADESCDPYAERVGEDYDISCSNIYVCSDWNQRTWKITNWKMFFDGEVATDFNSTEVQINVPETKFKKMLITDGPQFFGIFAMNHAVILVGYTSPKWQLDQTCSFDSFCANNNCISEHCTNNGDALSVSFNGFVSPNFYDDSLTLYYNKSSGIRNYVCENLFWVLSNTINCENNQVSINGQCMNNYQLPIGFLSCSARWENRILRYEPLNTTAWIFKNSWGTDWGDNGYGLITIISDSGNTNYSTTKYFGPYTTPTDTAYWPAGFNNTINCEDKDGDQYCNWGISKDKPSTCPAFCNARKDCDDSNPDLLDFISETNLNCRYKYTIER